MNEPSQIDFLTAHIEALSLELSLIKSELMATKYRLNDARKILIELRDNNHHLHNAADNVLDRIGDFEIITP